MNRKLAKTIESYIIALQGCEKHLATKEGNFGNIPDTTLMEHSIALRHLKVAICKISAKEISEMFSDLRDYWDTLEVGKKHQN